MARQKAQEKLAKAKKGGTSQLKQNAAAASYIVSASALCTLPLQTALRDNCDRVCAVPQCNICRTAFLCTMSKEKLQEHVSSKHEKSTFEVRTRIELCLLFLGICLRGREGALDMMCIADKRTFVLMQTCFPAYVPK